jgi:hypothetical protein
MNAGPSVDPPLRLLPFERYMLGAFIGVFGALRSGKTLMACRLAVCLARSLGLDLVSNIPVTGARRVATLDDLASLRGAVLVWDEVQVSLDSREWASEAARCLTRDMILWGKRGVICVYTSPSFQTVDVRLRRLTQYVYVTAGRFRRSGTDYAVYRWHEHPYADDVLVERYRFALRLDAWYGIYDTLYGASPGDTLAILPAPAPAPALAPARRRG